MSESDEKFIFRSVADVISRMHLMGADEANDIILDLKRNQRKRNAKDGLQNLRMQPWM